MYFVHACVEELQILSEWKYVYLVHACVMELQYSELGESRYTLRTPPSMNCSILSEEK